MTAEIATGRAEYLSAADTAKLVRKQLARTFPGYTFSVRSSVYAGGASVHVDYCDGPPEIIVRNAVAAYAGGGFDGMIDMAYNVQTWLEPDGTAYLASSPGTTGSRGVHESAINSPRSPNARLVSFGADHVLCQRELTPEATAEIAGRVVRRYGAAYLASQSDYEQSRLRNEAASRWLFPPCVFTYSIGRYSNGAYVPEEIGFPSAAAARRRAKELRGWRSVQAHRS